MDSSTLTAEELARQILSIEPLPIHPCAQELFTSGRYQVEDAIACLETPSRMRKTGKGNLRIVSETTGTYVTLDRDNQIVAFRDDTTEVDSADARRWCRSLGRDHVEIPDYVRATMMREAVFSDKLQSSIDRGYVAEEDIRAAIATAQRARRTLRGGVAMETPHGEVTLSTDLDVEGIAAFLPALDSSSTVEDMKEALRDASWHDIGAIPANSPTVPEDTGVEPPRKVSLPRMPGQKSKRGKLPTSAADLVKALESKGYECRNDNGHYRVTHPDREGMVVFASTPSDHRWMENTASTLRKVFDVDVRS